MLSGAVGGRQQLILVGYNIINDMEILDRHKINLHDSFDLISIADILIFVQNLSDKRLPQGLADLVLQYPISFWYILYEEKLTKGGNIFLRTDNADNDITVNLKHLICFIVDSLLDDNDSNCAYIDYQMTTIRTSASPYICCIQTPQWICTLI